ncbi:glycosyltransferase family 2 protein [Sulfitobacter sp. KE29]|uniref:glycosyltransferase family 2 protein n=1 Tax=unclassified Sulfitobacter TaxID=196795 RepID=UPI0023E318C5|nr:MULTISPECIES: glycosyltransferase family 2 protein [unclassified Sulfitobacter]MDF3420200.1 glycosyltransferase family 2 protein [Sulfitobacter sp. Ks38]MDF3427688.1 glycosyltransferase family 2 protein [Sulfitobacter sp. KE29]MDF3431267.1 glycosyltransferase family 2 protein [Sulfitobacter sp. S46]MDF3446053.1 glycosyltransferase family 2 protein [Sulfitobacter sp. KE31]MDF3550052.1 glycosyltransferase family 2 protein [Sulfitobacter sp. KE28]
MTALPSPQITVAIATMGERACQIPLPPPRPGLCYLVMIQRAPDPLPRSDRSDLTYVALDSLGLSRSRNAALEACRTPYLVFADDDMTLDTEGLCQLAQVMTDAPHLDFVAGWRHERLPAAGPRREPHRLRKSNAGRICAPELMVRMEPVRRAGLRFDPEFGVGAPYPVGEDYIFICDMLDAGLRGDGLPIVTGSHPAASTGEQWGDAQLMKARRRVLGRCFGATAGLITTAYILRHRKRFAGWKEAWRFLRG